MEFLVGGKSTFATLDSNIVLRSEEVWMQHTGSQLPGNLELEFGATDLQSRTLGGWASRLRLQNSGFGIQDLGESVVQLSKLWIQKF